MTITAVRIDGRLIHGQVANLWTTKLNISRIMVIDNEVAENDIEKQGLKLATPEGIKLSVLPVEKAANNILNNRYASQSVLIITRKPKPLLQLIDAGVEIGKINVGNMSQNEETKTITKSINVEKEDMEIFQELDNRGIELTHQMVPNSNEEDFTSLLEENIKNK